MPKPASDKSSAGICSHPECISDRRRTVLRIFLAAFAVLILFSLAAAPASAGDTWDGTTRTAFGGGGSPENPYIIDTCAKLAYLAQQVNAGTTYENKYFKVTEDLDLNSIEWTRIGWVDYTDEDNLIYHPFEGTFDGNGKTISGLYINAPNTQFQGLFGYTGDGAEIKDLGLTSVRVTGKQDVGGLVGQNYQGTIENCYATGTVTGNISVGGLMGWNNGGTIENCYATGTVTGTGEDSDYVGGLVGHSSGTITNCYATGTVTGTSDFVGGLVGHSSGTITNSVALNPSVSGSSNVGRVVGLNTGDSATITGCYAWDKMTITGSEYSGGAGTGASSSEIWIEGDQWSSESVWSSSKANFDTDDWGLNSDNAYYQLPVVVKDSDGNFIADTVSDAIFLKAGLDNFWGSETDEDNNLYVISDVYQLRALAQLTNAGNTNYNDKNYILANEINLNSYKNKASWTPIGYYYYYYDEEEEKEYYIVHPFTGTFDGDNKIISNLYINNNDDYASYLGLFGYTDGATINNLGVTDVDITVNTDYYSECVGGLVGSNYADSGAAEITNCYATGVITVNAYSEYVGGLAGDNCVYDSGTAEIKNCYANVEITVNAYSEYVGGLVGQNYVKSTEVGIASIIDCHAAGEITVDPDNSDYVGGLVGGNEVYDSGTAEIKNCYATGTVEGEYDVGGLVGSNYAEDSGTASITNCYATGAAIGDDSVGGLVGSNNADSSGNAVITDCYATGTVESDYNVGGLVGQNYVDDSGTAVITYCYATGTVTGGQEVGGLVGENVGGIITKSVALNPSVSATGDNVGRVVGENDSGTIDNCYAWNGISGAWTSDKNGKDGEDASSVYVWSNLDFYQNSDMLKWGNRISNVDGTIWRIETTDVPWAIPYLRTLGISELDPSKISYLKPIKITFYSNGGVPDYIEQNITKGFKAVEPIAPTKDGYTFGGWYTDSALTNKYEFDTHVMADIVLYAKWNPTGNPTPNPSSGGSSTDSGSGHFDEYPRTTTDGGFVTFGTSPTVSSVDLPKGVSGSVILVVKSNTPGPDGKPTYTVFEINIPNYPEGEEAVIQFKITLEELEKAGYNAEDICLYHCDENGVWTALPTTFTIKDGVVYYESVTTAFSPFAIVFEENGATEVTQPEVTAVKTQTPEPEPTYVEPTMPATTVPTPEQTKSPVGLVGLGLGLLGAAVVLRRK